MINYFNFNGIDSRDMGVLIRFKHSYDAPERDVTEVEVPGRDGNLIFDNGRFKNIPLAYGMSIIAPTFSANAGNENLGLAYQTDRIKKWLISDSNYHKLYDSYDPEYFRIVCQKGQINFDTKSNHLAYSEVSFTAKPYKYRFDGDQTITVTGENSSIVLTNPENYIALPLIKVYVNGTAATAEIYVNGIAKNIENVSYNVIIDSENETLKNGSSSANVTANFTEFPKLIKSGSTTITLTHGYKMEITPRWRTI